MKDIQDIFFVLLMIAWAMRLETNIDNAKIAKYYGMEKAYDFLYPHHRMDSIQIQDLKARLIFLFRLLKVDTVMCYDPWEHYEENPDHLQPLMPWKQPGGWRVPKMTTLNISMQGLNHIAQKNAIIFPGIPIKGSTELLISVITLIKKLNPTC